MINIRNSTVYTSLVRFIKSDIGIALWVTLAWKIIMLAIGYIIDAHIDENNSLLHHTGMWDGGWYGTIVTDQYRTNVASAAFYPLFPFLVGLIHTVSFHFIDILSAGQLINTTAVWMTVFGLITLGRIFFDNHRRYWLIALVLCSPAAFFMHTFYGEALFMAIGFWAYIFALRRQWLYMGILLAFLTSVRLPSLLFIGLCGLEFMRAYKWQIKKMVNKHLLVFLLAPLGFITYGLYLHIVQGDFLGMFHAYKATNDWGYQIFNINVFETIYGILRKIFHTVFLQHILNKNMFVNYILPITGLFIVGVCSLYALFIKKGKYIPLGFFGIASIIMFTLNSNVVSAHRYILPCLTIYLVVLVAIKGRYSNVILAFICAAGLALQLILFWLFIHGTFAG